MDDVEKRACAWIAAGDTGLSSETIWAQMMGVPRTGWRSSYPHDPSDLGRCVRLLRAVPEWSARMPEMASLGKQWAALAENWDELTAKYEIAESKARTVRDEYSLALYDRMRQIIDSARSIAVKP